MALIWISLMINSVEHLFTCLLAICISSLENLSSCLTNENKIYWHFKMVLYSTSTYQTNVRFRCPTDHLTKWNIIDVSRKRDWFRNHQQHLKSAPVACVPGKMPHELLSL